MRRKREEQERIKNELEAQRLKQKTEEREKELSAPKTAKKTDLKDEILITLNQGVAHKQPLHPIAEGPLPVESKNELTK